MRAPGRSAHFGEEGELVLEGVPVLISEAGRIVAREAVVGELWVAGIARLADGGAVDAVDGQEREARGADELAHLLDRHVGGEQLARARRVDAVEVGMRDGRARNAEMHFRGAGLEHHLHELLRRGAAHDAVVEKNDALATERAGVGRVFQLHAELANALLGLDEGAAHVVIADDA